MKSLLPLTLASAASLAAAPATPPNLVLIMADDMGYETIGAYGGSSYDTPHIDQLAAQGRRFDHAYSQPLCTPSRVQIMTGKYNVRNYDIFELLPNGQVTFGNMLQDAGYKTFVAGKWQLSERQAGRFNDPLNFGFDEYFLWQLERRANRYYAPGFEAHVPSEGWYGQRVNYPASAENFGPELVVNQINAFIERNKDVPFFVYYPMILPHDPFLATPDHPNFDPNRSTEYHNAAYFESMAEYADKMVGRVVAQLDAQGVADNTLVIFCGDNGTLSEITSILNGEPVQGGKSLTTDAGTRVPFIVRWPAEITPGESSDQLVDFTDVLPTLVDAAGGVLGGDLDGFSLLPDLRDGSGTPRQWSYCWYKPRDDNENKVKEFARTTRHRLYRTGQFYDVEADVLEQTPLDTGALDAEQQAAYSLLSSVLSDFDSVVADRYMAPRLADPQWASEPDTTSEPGVVRMVAAVPDDTNGPVRYQFENVTTSSISGWSFDPAFTVTGLAENVEYSFRYRTRDLLGNESGWSTVAGTSIVADPNAPVPVIQQSNQNGDSGAFNLGQSFTVPAALDGLYLGSVEFRYVSGKGGGSSWYLSIYDDFTDRTSRGNVLAVSTNEVAAPATDGDPMTWNFDDLVLAGDTTYYAVVSDAARQPLPAGQGVPAQRDDRNPYGGGQRLNESGPSTSVDLRFTVEGWAEPRYFGHWLIQEGLPSDAGFGDPDPVSGRPYALSYFLDRGMTDGNGDPQIDANGILRFDMRLGISDVDWRILYTEDLRLPRGNWNVKTSDSGDVNIDFESGEVLTDFSGYEQLFLSLEVFEIP